MIFGVIFFFLGLMGFTERGLPFSSKKRLTGKAAQLTGGLCITVGIGVIIAAFVFSTPESSSRMELVLWGVVIGSGLTWLVTYS